VNWHRRLKRTETRGGKNVSFHANEGGKSIGEERLGPQKRVCCTPFQGKKGCHCKGIEAGLQSSPEKGDG